MCALACQQRPCPALPKAFERSAIRTGPVAVVVVAPPARAERCIHLQDSIDDSQRVLNEWVARLANTIPNQLEETRIHDLFCRELPWRSRGTIVNGEKAIIGILIWTWIADCRRMNTNVVTLNS